MQFSPPYILFTTMKETEDTQIPRCRLSFTPKTSRQCTIECQKMPKIAGLARNISLRLPETAFKVVIRAL